MQLDNRFSVTRINLETFDYPKVEVHIWSDLFNAGGSVNVEAKTPEGYRLTLYKEEIEENRSVVNEREYAQELADDWNANLKENWLNEILRCYEYITDYQQKKVDEFDKELGTLKEYKSSIKKLKKLTKVNDLVATDKEPK